VAHLTKRLERRHAPPEVNVELLKVGPSLTPAARSTHEIPTARSSARPPDPRPQRHESVLGRGQKGAPPGHGYSQVRAAAATPEFLLSKPLEADDGR
jgi:hypothetical protein